MKKKTKKILFIILISIIIICLIFAFVYNSTKFRQFLGKIGFNIYYQNISDEIENLNKEDENIYENNVYVDENEKDGTISPYIFGLNEDSVALNKVKINSIRQGGNRLSTYNWENNYSNAGNDSDNKSDTYLANSNVPGKIVLNLSNKAENYNIKYKLTTLQMMGYVAADKDGKVTEGEVAPSKRWKKVEARKNSELSLNPDSNDDAVYMDEYINYIMNKLGDSTSKTGIQGYSLDNEPSLWNNTHLLAHKEDVTMNEVISKSIELAKVIKEADKNADVFGPALCNISAYNSLDNEENAKKADFVDDWQRLKEERGYDWFIDYYLDEMKKASDECNVRLLDYLDIHYYSEASDVPSKTLQSSRTLYDSSFKESSWISSTYKDILPILPKIQKSIDKYFPGTKIAVSEYGFKQNGNTISEGVAEVQYLTTFAKNDVGFATYFGGYAPYIYSAINLFTDCNGNGEVEKNIVKSETQDYTKVCTLATKDDNKLDIILTNNDMKNTAKIKIKIKNSSKNYKNAKIYGITKNTNEIAEFGTVSNIKNNEFSISIPSVSACRVILT